MAYDLEALGSAGFQDLAASLVVAMFGPATVVMGAGRDGGRDMHIDGPLTWPGSFDNIREDRDYAKQEANLAPGSQLESESWTGQTVFQVKHKSELAVRPQDNAAWLWSEVRQELEKWITPAVGREATPRQLVFISNVGLTPTPISGGRAYLERKIAEYGQSLADSKRDSSDTHSVERLRRLRRFRRINSIRFWDRSSLSALLSVHGAVRKAFKALLSVPDVLADLSALSDNLPAHELEEGLRRHARSALLSDGRLYFAEAGGGDSSSVQVHDVAIDLPVLTDVDADPSERSVEASTRWSLISYVLGRADHVLKPRVTTRFSPRHVILTGDPGNGKTTISRFLTQVYRASLLYNAANLGSDHFEIIQGTEQAMRRFGRTLPVHPRWPIRIDLAEYAEERGHLIDDSLIRWIAEKVNATSNIGDVKPRAMATWQVEWPWFVVLDGLDEVTEPSVRAKVIDRIVNFVNEAEGDNCDLFVLLTSRPFGFTERISPAHFTTIALADLTTSQAIDYGKAVTSLRLRDDLERQATVIRRLREAGESEAFRHLLRTPLQVLILTIIIDGSAGDLAPDRFSLFWGYYNTVFARERNKRTTLRGLLRDHARQITKLHERVGFELQRRSEEGDRSYAALTEDELRRIIRNVLLEAGHKSDVDGNELIGRIFKAATQRLVLIGPRGGRRFGFDIRPLQELSAGRHLTNGEFHEVASRLRAVSSSPHWRNAWIFAAGRLFAEDQDHLLGRLLELVEKVDSDAPRRLGGVVPVGPRLALDLLDDGMARGWPIYSNRLLILGLSVLQEPDPPDLPKIARTLVRYADTGKDQRRATADGFRALLAGSSTTRTTVQSMQQNEIESAEKQLEIRPLSRGLKDVRKEPGKAIARDATVQWDKFMATIAAASRGNSDLEALRRSAVVINHAREYSTPGVQKAVRDVLDDSVDAARVLESALSHVLPAEVKLLTSLRDLILPDVYRMPADFGDA